MQRKEVKAVLFDLDGVLVDSFEAWFHTFNEGLRHFGLNELSRNDFAKEFGAPIESDIKKYFVGKTIKEVKNIHNSNFIKWKKYVKLFPQSKEVLQKLKDKKIKVGLISNSTRFIVLATLNHFKIKIYFNAVVTMDDVKRRKPSPDMVLKACKILKVSPKNAILVGDTNNDMLAGKRAGCVTIGYKIKGNYKVNELRDITRFLD